MPSVLTLIASKAKTPLSGGLVRAVADAMRDKGVTPGGTDWLAPEEAADIPFSGTPREALAAAREAIGGESVDAAALPAEGRRKRLLIADMDSTLIDQECIDELAAEAGIGEKVAEITARAMAGEITFEPALRERVALLRDLPVAIASRLLDTRITLKEGGRTLVATMKAAGAHTVLVSGGFTIFAAEIARRLGIDEYHANTLQESDGKFTGTVAEPILGRDAKVKTLQASLSRLGIGPADALAVGDGANDAGMVELAGLGVALHGKPALSRIADADIRHGDLSSLLYLQGYRRSEFAVPEA